LFVPYKEQANDPESDHETELARRIREGGLGDRVQLLGYVPEAELADVYGVADCTLMPSLDLEGFGLATVESLACGTPVIASDAGANPELVAPLDAGLLYRSTDLQALAERLNAVLSGQHPLPSRARCAEYARARFPWERPVAAFEQAWEQRRPTSATG
jgi:glycosyltransferase involved in cell wall biosynthesis